MRFDLRVVRVPFYEPVVATMFKTRLVLLGIVDLSYMTTGGITIKPRGRFQAFKSTGAGDV